MTSDPFDQTRKLISNSQLILDELKKREPADSDVYASHLQEIKVVYESKDFSLSSSHARSMYGVRSIVGGRLGFMTTNTEDASALKAVAAEVQSIARLSPPSPHHQTAPAPGSPGHFEARDKKLVELSPKAIYTYAERVVAEATRDRRIAIDRAEFTWNVSTAVLNSSKGFSQSALASHCSWFAMGMAKTDAEVTSFDWDGSTVTYLADIDREIDRSMAHFRDSVLLSLGAKHGKTYRGPVLLHPNAVMDLIGGVVAANCTGIAHQDGISSWRGKVGETVASEQLLVYEDPLNTTRPDGWSPFDREGVPTAHHNLIDQGRLLFVAHNCFSAHRQGVVPTGNATGGSRSLPGIGFANLAVGGSSKATFKSEEELTSMLGSGLVIKRFSGNEDNVSGHFSGVAKNSWWIENGQRSHPVHEVMISGNLFDLIKNIIAVGNIQHRLIGGAMAPYILVDGISVTAS